MRFVRCSLGLSLKLDALPSNGQNINFYPRKAKEQNTPRTQNNQQNNNDNPNGQQQNHNNYGQNHGY